GSANAFFGAAAGIFNTASNNAFFGALAGDSNTSGTNNTFFGRNAGVSNTTSSNVTLIGANADVDTTFNPTINFATAIGAGAVVGNTNTVVLGRGVDTVRIPGKLRLEQLAAASNNHLCINFDEISTCSSSLRYKEHLAPFTSGLELINRLRPITFDWKHSGERDLGLAAEEVAAVEPLLVTYNKQGQIEGVKYDVITVVLVNAVRQQQQQITEKDEQIGNLRRQNSALDARLTVIEKKLSANKAARRQIARSAKRK
ncbi:MAG TPA: tail fiber domain-containing protein, partial [Blastocatellia bacterium]|nr:tail fiber domain-containing protein [Blastocatellia bacterium]